MYPSTALTFSTSTSKPSAIEFVSAANAELNKLEPIIVPVERIAVCFKKFLRVLLFSISVDFILKYIFSNYDKFRHKFF